MPGRLKLVLRGRRRYSGTADRGIGRRHPKRGSAGGRPAEGRSFPRASRDRSGGDLPQTAVGGWAARGARAGARPPPWLRAGERVVPCPWPRWLWLASCWPAPGCSSGAINNKLSASVAQARFYAILLAAFAALSLMLASAGVYGVLSYLVARQTHSIGVRRALGAVSGDILAMVLRKGVALVLLGLGIGLAAAAGATRLLAGLLFGLTATDLLSYVLAPSLWSPPRSSPATCRRDVGGGGVDSCACHALPSAST